MKPYELYNFIAHIPHDAYTTSGDSVQWCIKVDDIDKRIRLIFEESADKRDWINNFNFPVKIYKKQESCMLAARGWGNAWKSCNDEVMAALIKAAEEHPDYIIEICGWSYGGAMSILAAEDFCYRTHIKPVVTTFGAPKVIWGKRTQKYLTGCMTGLAQYMHVNDCVPLMPPFPGYRHVHKDKIGKGFCFLRLFNPKKWHTVYGEAQLYAC